MGIYEEPLHWQPPRTVHEFVTRFCESEHLTAEQEEYIANIIRGENHLMRKAGGRGGGKTFVRMAVTKMLVEAEMFDLERIKRELGSTG